MLSDEEKKALERIEDFLTTNIIVSISNDETADSEELKAFISKNEYLAIEFIASMFLKQSKEIEELKEKNENLNWYFENQKENFVHKDKIKAKIEEYEKMKEATKMDTTYYGEKRRSVIEGLIAELQSLLKEE